MTLQFIGDAGVYIPEADAVKTTAVHGGVSIACYVRRSALVALGCRPYDDPAALLAAFERHRGRTEMAAVKKFANGGFAEITLSASDFLETR
jgi:hypothetical protein